jgi:rubrerythrin
VQAALEILQSRGDAVPEQRDDRRVYVFPNLKETKVVRRCPYCGVQFPVKQAITQCPNCGGNIELQRT